MKIGSTKACSSYLTVALVFTKGFGVAEEIDFILPFLTCQAL